MPACTQIPRQVWREPRESQGPGTVRIVGRDEMDMIRNWLLLLAALMALYKAWQQVVRRARVVGLTR